MFQKSKDNRSIKINKENCLLFNHYSLVTLRVHSLIPGNANKAADD
ncbi:hypothetical protein D931_02211 [Enterococcus faecium 13.SD.W.09]|nr:hypothetical protein D931_02211 [Enterococcus faecium 13.SD.W.09]